MDITWSLGPFSIDGNGDFLIDIKISRCIIYINNVMIYRAQSLYKDILEKFISR